MPLVPVAENRVQLRPVDATPLQAPDFTAGLDAAARGIQQAAGAVADFAVAQDRIDATMDEAAAKKLDTQFSEFERDTLWNPEKGFFTLQGENALNARGSTEEALRKKREELLGMAETPRAKKMLGEALDRRLGATLNSVGSYSQRQAEVYQRDIDAQQQEELSQRAIAFRDQPEQFVGAIGDLRDSVLAASKRQGDAPEVSIFKARKAVSDVHSKVARAIAVGDPAEAARYLEINASEIEPLTKLALEKMLAEPLLEQEADDQAAAIRGLGAPVVAGPVAIDDLAVAVEGQESRGRNGLRSPKGALGVMQVMPGTAAELCKRLGIPFDEKRLRNDPEYCRRLGREYLAQQLQRYGGNATLALAAYNAGPGAVDGWLKSIGDPRKGEISDAEFVARIPFKETRDYVPGVMKRLGAGGGPQNAPRENDLAGQLAKADAISDPKLRDKVRSKLMAMDSVDQRLLKDVRDRAADEAWTIAMEPGFTSVRQIRPDLWSRLDVSVQRQLSAAAAQNLKGTDPVFNPQLYTELSDMASLRPQEFARLNLSQYAHQMPKGDWEQFVTLQRSVRAAKGAKAPEQVTHDRIRSVTNDLATAAGIDDTGLKGDKRAKVNAKLVTFRKRVADDVAAFVAANKRQPTDDEIVKMADRWLIKVSVVGGSDDVYQFETRPGDQVTIDIDAIPEAEADAIRAEYARRGKTATDDDVRRIYLRSRNRGR